MNLYHNKRNVLLNFKYNNIINNMEVMVDVTNRISAFLARQGYGEPLIDKVILCLDELISNIYKYGYINSPNHKPFTIDINDGQGEFFVVLSDNSQEFNPFEVDYAGEPDDNIENWQIGRLGMKLVKSMVKSFHYARNNNQNIITLGFAKE